MVLVVFWRLGTCGENTCCKAGRKAALAAGTRLVRPMLGVCCLGKENTEPGEMLAACEDQGCWRKVVVVVLRQTQAGRNTLLCSPRSPQWD